MPRKVGIRTPEGSGFVRIAAIILFAVLLVIDLFVRGIVAAHASGAVLFETTGPFGNLFWGGKRSTIYTRQPDGTYKKEIVPGVRILRVETERGALKGIMGF
jgi:hypothetical protein